MKQGKVWFVTGASKGLGLTLVKKLLSKGYRVAATSRTVDSLVQLIGQPSESFLPLKMNLVDNQDVKNAIQSCVAHFGQIDVIVNNAGYSLIGTLEELTDAEVKDNFEVNVYGSLNVIRNAAPFLRKQKSGHIFNIASIGGYDGGYPVFGVYCSTKFAVAGFTEALAEEMKDFDVNVTLVYPGYFRTEFLTGDSVKRAANPIAEYKSARESEQNHLNEINGNQPNDPEKGVEILIGISEKESSPVHLFLGKDAYSVAKRKIGIIQNDLAFYEGLATSTQIVNI
ncbi:SDR family oxidoreductase [Flavobacterium sp.]|uniref:SDR family oxidoreductase n=1 Tax=Flavobacterium sp. TaxID=239 RepID=UPI00121F7AAB|nr:SDR family oxidoreductase [Flavobacterium sp.]RZJ73074.1 MAG: SDR family oxidoreductase [Flavobacterium sp.]